MTGNAAPLLGHDDGTIVDESRMTVAMTNNCVARLQRDLNCILPPDPT
jgi:hypothetical protein